MNKKILNAVLIIFLLVIWGGVIFKFFGKKSQSTEHLNLSNFNSGIDYQNISSKENFKFELSDRDPFDASTLKAPKISVTRNSKSPSIKPEKTKQIVVWPAISYLGFIKNDNNKNKLVLLRIDNKLHRKRENELINDIKIKKAYSDSIILSINNHEKTILKGQ